MREIKVTISVRALTVCEDCAEYLSWSNGRGARGVG